jgi:hypothetical protein
MPLVGESKGAAPSHLGDVLRAVRDTFEAAGDATPIRVGAHYVNDKSRGIGAPPFVVFVPEPKDGRCTISYAYEMGRPAKHVHACDVIVRAETPGDDIDRLSAAYALNDRVVQAVKRAGAGRIVFGEPEGEYPSPFTADSGAGVQLSWGFTYDRDIRGDDDIAAVPASAPDDTPDRPISPPGETGTIDTITGTTVAADEEGA